MEADKMLVECIRLLRQFSKQLPWIPFKGFQGCTTNMPSKTEPAILKKQVAKA